jgi:hypothetical protein
VLGYEDPVDRQDGGEQHRDQQYAGGEASLELLAVKPEAEQHEGGEREQRHRRHRLEGAKLDPQVLDEDGAKGAADAHRRPP